MMDIGALDDVAKQMEFKIWTNPDDQYGATLAQWMGMSAGDVNDIFPNLKNFDEKSLGFV